MTDETAPDLTLPKRPAARSRPKAAASARAYQVATEEPDRWQAQIRALDEALHTVAAQFRLAPPECATLVQEWARRTVLSAAPIPGPGELWRNRRDRHETPPEFIDRVYGPQARLRLAMSDLRRLDKDLYRAFYNWRRARGGAAQVLLPTKKQKNDALLALVEQSGDFDALSALALKPNEVLRLKAVASKRATRTPKS